ncbi:MAG: hypothetical protein JWM83_1926 [Candidatus Angelobacter sp.]|nr:hypothetical protein [Candidatus Angelobacter sp.]
MTKKRDKEQATPPAETNQERNLEIQPLEDSLLDGIAGGTGDSPLCAPPGTL